MNENFFFIIISLDKVLSMLKKLLHIVRNKTKKNYENWLKNKKVIQCQKMLQKCPENSKFLV